SRRPESRPGRSVRLPRNLPEKACDASPPKETFRPLAVLRLLRRQYQLRLRLPVARLQRCSRGRNRCRGSAFHELEFRMQQALDGRVCEPSPDWRRIPRKDLLRCVDGKYHRSAGSLRTYQPCLNSVEGVLRRGVTQVTYQEKTRLGRLPFAA